MSIKPGEELIRTVNIDESIGRDTTFAFEYTGSPRVVIEVISPSGKRYTLYGPNSYAPDGAKVRGIRINENIRVRKMIASPAENGFEYGHYRNHSSILYN